MKQVEGKIQERFERIVAGEGFELVDVEWASDRGRMILRLFIDTIPPSDQNPAAPGVLLEDCSRISHVVGDVLDAEDLVSGEYHLEVSSPGMFRPLTKEAHFERALGRRIKVKLYQKQDNRRVFTGELKSYAPDRITVLVDGADHELALKDVAKANLEPLLDV